MFLRKALWSVACSGLVSCLCFPGLAHAQNTAVTEPADTASAEIIVTAQRRTQSIQDVPIAISAIGADTLEDRGIVSLVDLQGVVPGVNISGSSGANGSNMVSIRGIVAQPVPLGTSQPTAVYLDGVYLPKPDGAFFGLQDVERIEVLRGPQGTLYGRNATAGAINIITRAPTDRPEGKLDASYGNFNAVSVGGYLMGGLAEHLTASFSGSYNDRD
ncbi:MAG: TonB-dependent receptor plug domain-containing protein, partial [Candidatus Promineofilum sp.]|nr:TonB-dependent receptor plug domain-containing protein [Promineifilum sp.]